MPNLPFGNFTLPNSKKFAYYFLHLIGIDSITFAVGVNYEESYFPF